MDKKIIYEEFNSINELLNILNSRSNNKIMQGKNSSDTGDIQFTHTNNYKEAVDLFKTGYTEVLPDIKLAINKNNKIIQERVARFQHKPLNMPIGYIPNVPNALQNKPDSMINVLRQPIKKKTLTVVYAMGGSWINDKSIFIKAGSALISALNLIELSGIQTKLMINFMPVTNYSFFSHEPEEILCPTLILKDYGERFNLQKLCFPLAHPSMFRRIGFKYLETCPKITQQGFRGGYGTTAELKDLAEGLEPYLPKGSIVIDSTFIKNNDYSVEAIIDKIGVLKNGKI